MFRHGKSDALIKMFEGQHPMGRIGQPDEMASVVAMFAREEARWVNGQTWFVNGVSTFVLFHQDVALRFISFRGLLSNSPWFIARAEIQIGSSQEIPLCPLFL